MKNKQNSRTKHFPWCYSPFLLQPYFSPLLYCKTPEKKSFLFAVSTFWLLTFSWIILIRIFWNCYVQGCCNNSSPSAAVLISHSLKYLPPATAMASRFSSCLFCVGSGLLLLTVSVSYPRALPQAFYTHPLEVLSSAIHTRVTLRSCLQLHPPLELNAGHPPACSTSPWWCSPGIRNSTCLQNLPPPLFTISVHVTTWQPGQKAGTLLIAH